MAAVMLGCDIALSGVSCAVPTETSTQPRRESCTRASFCDAAVVPCTRWRIGAFERSAVRWAVRAVLTKLSVDNDALTMSYVGGKPCKEIFILLDEAELRKLEVSAEGTRASLFY